MSRNRLGGFLRWFLAEGAGTIVALVTGVIAVLFTLFPDLKPFTATTKAAHVSVVTVERGVTRDEWRWRRAVGRPKLHARLVDEDRRAARRPPDEPCAVLGEQPGYSAYVRTEAEGFKRRELTVRAELYRFPSRRQVRFAAAAEGERYRPLARVPIDAPSAGSVQEIWVYDPGGGPRTRFFVRVALYDPDEHMLDVVDSRPFPRTSDRELANVAGGCRRPP